MGRTSRLNATFVFGVPICPPSGRPPAAIIMMAKQANKNVENPLADMAHERPPAGRFARHFLCKAISASSGIAALRAHFAEERAYLINEELGLLQAGEVATLGHLRIVHKIKVAFEDAARRIQ